jgi:hypothetical protein
MNEINSSSSHSAKKVNVSDAVIESMRSKTYQAFQGTSDLHVCNTSIISPLTDPTVNSQSNGSYISNNKEKILRVQKNTLGNKNIISHSERRLKRKLSRKNNGDDVYSDIYNDEKIYEILQSSANCCKKNFAFGGCLSFLKIISQQ